MKSLRESLSITIPARMARLPIAVRYAIAFIMTLSIFGLRHMILGQSSDLPYLLSLPVIVACSYLFRFGPGIFASVLSFAYAGFFILPHGQWPNGYETYDLVGLELYAICVLIVVYIVELFHHANACLTASNDEVDKANAALVESEATTSMLLRESWHRSRNDLQRFAATLAMQALISKDLNVRAALTDAEARVIALASLNARLDGALITGKRDSVDSRVFLSGLVSDLRTNISKRPITLSCTAESHSLMISRAVAVGQIVQELVMNSIRHAYPAGFPGKINVRFAREDNHCVLEVSDDGIGMSPDVPAPATGMGTRLIKSLVENLNGKLEITQPLNGGTLCSVRSPVSRIGSR